jgi:hypothetical protein
MEGEEEYIEEFSQLPSRTGKDVIDLEKYARLPRTNTYENVEAFLEAARKSREVKVLFIVAEWGEGKTSIYEGLLKKPEVIKSDLVIPISTKRLITHIKEKSSYFSDTASPGIRFFACLLYTIKDIIDNDLTQTSPFNKILIAPKSEEQATMDFIWKGLKSLFNILDQDSRVFIFLDEFEDIVDESVDIRSFIIAGLVDVINGYPRCLTQKPFAGRFHLLIAATPPAYERLVSETYTDARRFFGQRALKIDLEKLDRKNAYNYILGILKYCWEGKIPKIPFRELGMFNAIYLSTLGNPRSIVNLIEMLLTRAKRRAPNGKIKVINPEDFIQTLSGQKIEVYGGEVSLLDKNSLSMLYSKLEQKCKKMGIDVNRCIDLTHLLLSNLSPLSIEEIKQKVKLKEDLLIYLNAVALSFGELWNIEPFIHFKKVAERADEVYSRLKSMEAPPHLSRVISALEFYEFDQENLSLVNQLFIPHQHLSELSFKNRPLFQNYIDFFTSFSPELRSEDEITVLVDRYIFDKVEKTKEDYIMLSPAALNIFYPSPSIFFLDFIEDLDKRFEIGTKIMRNLTDFEKEFYEGVIKLLEDGCERINIKKNFESYGFKDIEVINLSYREVAQQYSLRTRVLSPLRISEEKLRSQIESIAKEMKTAHIPLLIIFSWNPLPNEIKGVLETFFGPGKGVERVFYYLELPLTTIQCHQVIGYVLAQKNNYNIRRERWKARASRIINEIRFEDDLENFINNGITAGYTIKQLVLEELKPNEVPEILRTLLITDGNIKERYKQIRELEDEFKIFGKEFPVCPKDFESENAFEKYVNELKENGFIKESDGALKVDYTPVEKRILAILREYGGSMQKDEIDNLFISLTSYGRPITTGVYLEILKERKDVGFSEGRGFFLRDIKVLNEEFESIKRNIQSLKDRYADFPYGFLVSVKQREINAIIVRDCILKVEEIINSLDKTRFLPEYEEIRIRRQILLELLVKHLNEVVVLLNELFKEFRQLGDYKAETIPVIKSLTSLEESLNNLPLIAGGKIRIREKRQIEEKKMLIEEIEKRDYTREEMKKLAQKLKDEINSEDLRGLSRSFRGCPVFDVKMIQMMQEIIVLNRLIGDNNLNSILEAIEKLIKIRDSIKDHKILSFQYENEFSLIMQNWIKQNMKSMEGV